MTCIVTFKTKKDLRAAVDGAYNFSIYDPSIVNPRAFRLYDMKVGEVITVTNHPKRSWFAEITHKGNGVYIVK